MIKYVVTKDNVSTEFLSVEEAEVFCFENDVDVSEIVSVEEPDPTVEEGLDTQAEE